MTQTKTPRHLVREYLDRRTHPQQDDPPSPDEIREQLGLRSIPDSGATQEVQE